MKISRIPSVASIHRSSLSYSHLSQPARPFFHGTFKALKGFVHLAFNFLLSGSEPKIRQTQDQQGKLIWHLYDPITRSSAQVDSEEEVRIWLERRYNLK